jgi:uncharacterized damage-inducible protein DinB
MYDLRDCRLQIADFRLDITDRGTDTSDQRPTTKDYLEMTSIDRIHDQLLRAYEGDPWCGPSLRSVLGDVSADQAAARVAGLSHSIHEIVLHLAAWQNVVAVRIKGGMIGEPDEGDWPAVNDTSDAGWKDALDKLDASFRALLLALPSLDEASLDQKLGDSREPALGTGMTVYANLHGVAQHAMYHAGQIALLKKLVAGE